MTIRVTSALNTKRNIANNDNFINLILCDIIQWQVSNISSMCVVALKQH